MLTKSICREDNDMHENQNNLAWQLFADNALHGFHHASKHKKTTLTKILSLKQEVRTYKVFHKGWDFRNNCTEFVLSVFLFAIPCIFKLVCLFAKSSIKSLENYILGRIHSLTLGSYRQTVSGRLYSPIFDG